MKSVIFAAPNKIIIQDVEIPKIAKDDVLMKVKAVAICNATDTHFLKGEIPGVRYPLPPGKPGHECSGEVIEVGKNVKQPKIGDRVVPGPLYALPCGECYYCMRGMQELCENPGEADFAYAEYLKAPAKHCHQLPENVSFAEGALIDLLACTLHGADRANFSIGESVTIIGQGPAGLLLSQLARLAGVNKIITCDIYDSRLMVSKKLAADFTVNTSKENLIERVMKLTDMKGCDVAIDAVGKPFIVSQAVEILRPKGRVIIFGFHLKPAEIDLARIFERELELKASYRTVGKLDYCRAISLVADKKIDLKSLITHTMPMERIKTALELIGKGAEGAIKIILKP